MSQMVEFSGPFITTVSMGKTTLGSASGAAVVVVDLFRELDFFREDC